MNDRQPAKAGDEFRTGATLVRVTRCSRNPEKPWVDIDVFQDNGAMWSKRMPTGIPAAWQPVDPTTGLACEVTA